jgi:hypothetical protein
MSMQAVSDLQCFSLLRGESCCEQQLSSLLDFPPFSFVYLFLLEKLMEE